MKTKTIILLLAIAGSVSFNACKKGAHDPTISFKSRTARLSGEWKLVSGTITTTQGTTSMVETYDGTTVVTTVSGVQTGSEAYTDDLTFDKKGKYTRTGARDTTTFSEEGAWAWIGKCKDANLKKKEAMGLSSTKYTDSNGSNDSDAGFFVAGIWMLDELSSKKMVVVVDGNSTSGGVTTKKQGTYTFDKQ
jgi:hypothetical protein